MRGRARSAGSVCRNADLKTWQLQPAGLSARVMLKSSEASQKSLASHLSLSYSYTIPQRTKENEMTVEQMAMKNLTKKQVKARIQEGYKFMVIGVANDNVVDRRYAKDAEEAEQLAFIVSGQSYIVRLNWL